MQIGLGLWLGTRQVGDGSSLNLNFLSGSLDSRIDFTRTTSATFVGSNGLIQNTPQSRNLLTWTQEFDNAAWTKSQATVTANTTVAPDGTMTADTLIEDTTNTAHAMQQSATLTAAAHTFSVYLKAKERTWAQVLNGTVANGFAYFNLSTGAVGTVGAGVTATSVTSVGNGWYRCSITFTAPSGGNILAVWTASANGTGSYLGDGTSGIFVWGAQLEQVPDANLVLGSELVTNGDFSGGLTGWTSGGAIASSLVSGEAQITFAGSAALSAANWFSQADVLTDASKVYRVAFDATWVSGGVLQVSSGFDIQRTITAVGTNKTGYVTYVRRGTTGSVANQQTLVFAGAAGAVWKIDNVTVKEITGTVGMPSDYTRNVGGLFPARFDYDPVSLAPRGILIEEQRTNLLLNSLINGTSLATQNVTVAAVAHTFSFYGTGTVTVSGAHSAVIVGTGAYPARTTLTFTPSAGTLTVTVAGTVQFANLEAGAFATSYIPTVASQVTRTADQASIVAPMFAPWYNQTEGTFVVEWDGFKPTTASGTPTIFQAGNATDSFIDAILVGGNYLARTFVGGVSQAEFSPAYVANATEKFATAYKVNDFAFSRNGATALVDTSGNVPTNLDRIGIGITRTGTSVLNGHIRRITYYPVRLLDTQLQALSA